MSRFTIISSKNVELVRLKDMKRSPDPIKTKQFNVKGFFVRDVKLVKDYQRENALNSALEQIPGTVDCLMQKSDIFITMDCLKKSGGTFLRGLPWLIASYSLTIAQHLKMRQYISYQKKIVISRL